MNEESLLEIVRKQEEQIRAQRFESAYFWDQQGNLLFTKDGEVDRITFSDEEILRMHSAIATHNHPHGWKYSERDPRRAGYTFSSKDMQLACQASLLLIRVVTPKFRYMMKPSLQGWNKTYGEKSLHPEYQRTYQEVRTEYRAKVQARLILQTEAESLLRHEVWSRVAARLGLVYCREEF